MKTDNTKKIDIEDAIMHDLYMMQEGETSKIVRDAFERHFGIPIDKVDPREIELLTFSGDPVEYFRYRGEMFLQMEQDAGVIERESSGAIRVKYTTRYKEV